MKYLFILLTFISVTLSAQRVVIVNTDTGEKTFTKFPSVTDTVIGLQPNLKLYYVLEKQKPAYDKLTEKLVSIKTFTDSIGDGKKYPYYVYDYKVEALPDTVIQAQKQLAVAQKQLDLVVSKIDDDDFMIYTILTVGVLLHERKGNTVTARMESDILDVWYAKAIQVYPNFINRLNLIEAIKADPSTDINQNWNE